MLRFFKTFVVFTAVIIAVPAFAGDDGMAKFTFGDNKWVTLHYLLQVQGYTQNTYEQGEGETDSVWSKGFQIRRSRIMLKGQAAENVTFFMETDDIMIGSQGPASRYDNTDGSAESSDKDRVGVYTQDAYINYRIADELQIAVGMISLPFMHQSRQSSVSLLGIDYNTSVIPLDGTTNAYRDTGAEARGLVFGGKVDYRLGVWKAAAERDMDNPGGSINPYDYPRYSGRIQINIMDPETGFFYSGNYLGKRNILSFGGGVDYQNHAVRSGGDLEPYFAWTGDLTVDVKLGRGLAVTLQGAYVGSYNNPGENGNDEKAFFAQAGFLMFNVIQPVAGYQNLSVQNGDDDGSDLDVSCVTGGVNYFIDGHNANIKLECRYPLGENKSASGEKKGTIQCQIFI